VGLFVLPRNIAMSDITLVRYDNIQLRPKAYKWQDNSYTAMAVYSNGHTMPVYLSEYQLRHHEFEQKLKALGASEELIEDFDYLLDLHYQTVMDDCAEMESE
jgi:hypothetical protein